MQLSVRYNASGIRVLGYGEPHLYLLEVSGVQGRTISYNSTNEHKFGAREWQAIVGSGGDFSAIGYLFPLPRQTRTSDSHQSVPR